MEILTTVEIDLESIDAKISNVLRRYEELRVAISELNNAERNSLKIATKKRPTMAM